MADLVSFDDLKAFLALEKDAITDYPVLDVIRAGVQASFENHTGRDIKEEDNISDNGFCAGQTGLIPLTGLPIKSISELLINGSAFSEEYYNIGAFGLFLITPLKDFSWSVKYKGGFEDYPEDLKRAGLYQTIYEYQQREHLGTLSVTTESGGGVRRREEPLTAEVEALLSKYTHINKISA